MSRAGMKCGLWGVTHNKQYPKYSNECTHCTQVRECARDSLIHSSELVCSVEHTNDEHYAGEGVK